MFLPGIKEEPSAFEGEKPGWIEDHNYVLEPVGGIARYFKLGQKDTREPEAPAQKAAKKSPAKKAVAKKAPAKKSVAKKSSRR